MGRRGFSLAEVLVAVGIAAVGLLMIFQIYPMGFAVSSRSQAKAVDTAIASQILAVYRGELQRGPASEHWATGLTLRNPAANSLFRQVTQSVNGQTAFNFPSQVSTGWTLGMFYWKAYMEEVASPQGSVANRPLYGPQINSTLMTASQAPAVDVDLVGARRITVFVRGPFTDLTTAGQFDPIRGALSIAGAFYRVSAAEVVLSTVVTTSRVGSTVSVTGSGGGGSVGAAFIDVATADGFSVFDAGALYTNELQDTGAPPFDPAGPPPPASDPVQATTNPYPTVNGVMVGGDYYGLDNVWIGTCPGDYSQGESNKIVGIERPTGQGYYRLWLARRLRGFYYTTTSNHIAWPVGTPVRTYTKAWTN